MDDFRPALKHGGLPEELQDGECVCGAFDCPTEYACHTSGY